MSYAKIIRITDYFLEVLQSILWLLLWFRSLVNEIDLLLAANTSDSRDLGVLVIASGPNEWFELFPPVLQ